MEQIKVAAIIPARMSSSRYPGKPLLEIAGIPMIEHVRRRTALCNKFSNVVVATCDKEIADKVASYGGSVIMTSADHLMATDRVAEAVEKIDCTHVVNVQGDEILIMPNDLEEMVMEIKKSPSTRYWNAGSPVEHVGELADRSIVKCVVSNGEKILYCSRDFSNLGLTAPFAPLNKLLGVLGYTRDSLKDYRCLARTPIEMTQSIDQSRIIEHDEDLVRVPFRSGYPGINEPREEAFVRSILETNKEQQSILKLIL